VSPQAELRDLSARLAEAEATIQALLSGQIDAVFDAKSGTPLLLAEAQTELRNERDHARRCLDTPDVLILALDVDGRITLVNRYACDALGWTEAELLGRNWSETCLPPRARGEFVGRFHRVLSGDRTVVLNPILTKSGEERLIEWRNTAIKDASGRVVGSFSAGSDVTDRVQAVEAAQVAAEREQFALGAAGVGIWDIDYITGHLQWSATMESQYGLLPGTFGQTFEAFVDLIHPEDRASLLDIVGAAMKTGGDFSVLSRSTWPDGTVHWLSGEGKILLDEHGKAVRGVGISQDITERRTLEAQFLQAQKMEAVGRLASGVAHDFNNLLTVILGFCEILMTDLPPDDRHQPDLGEIQKAGASAARLTGQLLAFSRKEILEPKLLDLNQVVAQTLGMLGRLIGEDVSIRLDLWRDPVPVKADRGQLDQVLMNLAVNARDAMPKGGTLTISTAVCPMGSVHSQALDALAIYTSLTVADTGSGMTPAVQARLFEPFFTTKPAGQGTGLGLATVHSIVSRNGGEVTVRSEVGCGTAFTVYLPKSSAADMVATLSAAIGTPGAGITILVVEDADGLRVLTQRMLERQGYTVLVARNADEALRVFESNATIDLVLSDVVMPGASGPELTRQLVKQRPGLKVLYMSGYTDDAIIHHGVLKPGIAFLHKPFTGQTLGQKIRDVLSGTR
jgi:two-component system cell cycle sensor histidine kinase/response regulator CckA